MADVVASEHVTALLRGSHNCLRTPYLGPDIMLYLAYSVVNRCGYPSAVHDSKGPAYAAERESKWAGCEHDDIWWHRAVPSAVRVIDRVMGPSAFEH